MKCIILQSRFIFVHISHFILFLSRFQFLYFLLILLILRLLKLSNALKFILCHLQMISFHPKTFENFSISLRKNQLFILRHLSSELKIELVILSNYFLSFSNDSISLRKFP